MALNSDQDMRDLTNLEQYLAPVDKGMGSLAGLLAKVFGILIKD
ncbi:hypothetical protein [Nitrosovibrio sp. Nv6]|nr:hypothetical protein [Nitrosovibrio sp. Nv6]